MSGSRRGVVAAGWGCGPVDTGRTTEGRPEHRATGFRGSRPAAVSAVSARARSRFDKGWALPRLSVGVRFESTAGRAEPSLCAIRALHGHLVGCSKWAVFSAASLQGVLTWLRYAL
jgi:hypothetical protein